LTAPADVELPISPRDEFHLWPRNDIRGVYPT
jgi:hypothetical protein